jgi:transcriptional regulator with XRE-family HTH domain
MDREIARIRRVTCEKIKYYRRIHKLSQSEMAARLWMSNRAYHRLENGETALTLERLFQVSKVLEVPVGKLMETESQYKNEDVLRAFQDLNQHFINSEKKILELLHTLKKEM